MNQIRVAVVADSHWDASKNGRLEECVRMHDWIADDIAARGDIDAILHSGDVYQRKSVPEDRNAATAWVGRCADLAPVVIVRGNHDVVGDLAIFSKLRSKYRITVEEACGTHCLVGQFGRIAVGAVAWPRKAHLLANLPEAQRKGVTADELGEMAQTAMRDLLRGVGGEMALFDAPRILLMHAMVRGSLTSSGQPLAGCDLELGIEDLALCKADAIALGHVHKGQDWTYNDVPIVYPGSPRRTAYGEVEDKGYVIMTFERVGTIAEERNPWKCTGVQRVVAPAQRMFLLEDEWGDDSAGDGWKVGWGGWPDSPDDLAGADVRVRYRVKADKREAAGREAAEFADELQRFYRVERVKVEERVIATARPRLPEVIAERDVGAKVALIMRQRGIPADRAARIAAKHAVIEDEMARS